MAGVQSLDWISESTGDDGKCCQEGNSFLGDNQEPCHCVWTRRKSRHSPTVDTRTLHLNVSCKHTHLDDLFSMEVLSGCWNSSIKVFAVRCVVNIFKATMYKQRQKLKLQWKEDTRDFTCIQTLFFKSEDDSTRCAEDVLVRVKAAMDTRRRLLVCSESFDTVSVCSLWENREFAASVADGAGSDAPRRRILKQVDVQMCTRQQSCCPPCLYFKISQVFLHRARRRSEELQSAPVRRQSRAEERRVQGRLQLARI